MYKLIKISYYGGVFENEKGEQITIDLNRTLGSGMAIYPDCEYGLDELEDYIIEEGN